ncbi:peptidoglycan-binding domain-containing protein [Vescimonas sanitatis]|uniref:peptidoglycan-binding domain-containing protein n=1 Tax=Vescimonas sanitatis TaxID=3376993 RepID=UPI003B77D4E3
MDAFANGDTISAELHSAKSGNTEIRDAIVFDYPGKTLTLNMNGYTLENEGAPVITVEAGTLKITGDAIINQIAAGAELITPAIRVTGGELIFENNLTVTGGKAGAMVGSAIEVTGNGTVTFQGEVNATAQLIDSTTSDPDLSPAIKVTGGTVTFAQKLTATGGRYDDKANRKQQQPAVSASGGTLDFQNGLELNGGLTLTGDAALKNKLTQGTFTAIEGIDVRRVSVDGSNPYKRIADLLEDGYAFADNNKALVEAGGSYNIWTISDLTIVPHTHDWKPDSTYTYLHRCACGASDNHSDWKDGKCGVCGYACLHESVNNDGTCFTCGEKMTVEIVAKDGTTTYGTDFKAAMKAAENGTTVKLLADIEWGVTPQDRAAITGDGKIVTLNLNGHTITGGWFDIGSNNNPTSCTLKIIGEGGHESLEGMGGYSGVSPKATLDLSEWEGGTISAINISDDSKYDETTREAAVIVGPKAGTIGKLTFGNNQLGELKKTKLSGGSFNEIWAANNQPVKLGELLADGYAYQNEDGSYVKYETTLRGASIYNVKVVKCLHPNMKPGEDGVATCEYCGKSGKFVASVDGNLYTADQWKDAFKAWLGDAEDEKANGILKLYTDYKAEAADATWSVGYRPNGNTLDLNGHRMSVQGDGAFKPTNNMHLTVTDGTERGQIENILLDGNQRGSFTLESGYVGNLEMTGGAVVALKGGSVDKLDVQNCSANTNLSIQGGSIGKLNIKDWADGMHVSATGGSLGAYNLPSGKILADVLDHQYYATGTSLDKRVDAVAQKWEKFVIKQAPYDFGSTSKAANVPINGSIPFMVGSPSENVGLYDVKWYRRTNSGAEHMTLNRVADVKVGDTLDVFCVITGLDRPGGAMQWQVAVKDYTINVVPAKLNDDRTVIRQKPDTGNTQNPADNRLVVTPFSSGAFSDVEYKFEVTYNGQPLELNKDYTIKDSNNWARNAGTHTLTIEGMGNYTGQKSVTWMLEPYELSVENYRHAQINKTYDGTDAVTDSTNGIDALGGFMLDSKNPRNPILLTLDNLDLDKSDYELSNMKFDSAEAGDRTFTGTMTLTPGGNFVFAKGSRVMQIEYSSDRMPVYISSAIIAAPAAKALQVANNHAATYTVDLSALLPALEAPREYGAVTYGAPTVNLSSGYYTDGARVEDGKLILPIRAVETKETGSIGSVKVKVSTTNYHDFTLTIDVSAENRITPTGTPTLSKNAITYGDALNTIALSGKMEDPTTGAAVEGTFTWQQPGNTILDASTFGHDIGWTFTPNDGNTYTEATGTATVKVDKARRSGEISMTGYTYGQMPSIPSLTEQTGDPNVQVTYYYSSVGNGNMQVWSINDPPALNAGTYRMSAKIGETNNYYEYNAEFCEFVVAKATPAYTAPTGLTAKYGQTLADVTLPDGWSWTDSSESVGGASTAAKTFQAKFIPTDTENYNMVENIELEVMVNKADGGSLKTVELEQKYTDTSEHTYTPDWAGLPAGQDWTFSSEASIVLSKQDFAADGSLLTYAISGGKVGDKITITLKASCNNYEDFTIALTITLTEKDNQQALRITGGTTVVYGQTLQLGTSGGSGSGAVIYTVTNGTGEATIDATGKLTPVKVGKVKVRATKAGDASYNSITSSPVEITITRAVPTGEPAYTKITTSGKTLADAALGIGTITPAGGTIAWDDPTTTEVVANKSYGWTYTPTDTNYTTLTGSIQLWHKSTSSGGGSYYAPTVPDMPMLYRGCTGDAVKTLQDKLNTLGYNSGNVDGIFGAKTYAAVTAFQKANSLGVDGIVGKLTWAKLYDATPVNVTPVTTQPMLRTGSRGDAVRKLQEMLNAKGYTCGNVDGIFGSKTYAAVLAFQKANGLGADGIVGPLTWGKLV